MKEEIECDYCEGEGQIVYECPECHGKGSITNNDEEPAVTQAELESAGQQRLPEAI